MRRIREEAAAASERERAAALERERAARAERVEEAERAQEEAERVYGRNLTVYLVMGDDEDRYSATPLLDGEHTHSVVAVCSTWRLAYSLCSADGWVEPVLMNQRISW